MNFKIVIVALASAAILYQGWDLRNDYVQKATIQKAENQSVIALRETWVSLAPAVEKWNKMFKLDADVNDLNGVYNALNIESSNLRPSSLLLNDAGRTMVKDEIGDLIGLSRTCITNSVLGFVLKADFVSTYINSLGPFLKRGDIEYNRISMMVDKDADDKTPYIAFDKLCVVLRGSDTFMDGIEL